MKNRSWWFISFYLLLSTFIIYELIFLIILSRNISLKDLYDTGGFVIVRPSPTFNPISYASFFYLALAGLIINSIALISGIVTSRIFIKKSPHFKFLLLVLNFIIFAIGFLISFSGELLYSQWDNANAIIQPCKGGFTHTANFYYQNWFSSTIVWSIFGLYFALLVALGILLLKLNLINIQTYHFYRQREAESNFEPELKQPLPSSNEFDPNDTQTITIFLDDEEVNNKVKTRKHRQQIVKSPKKKLSKKQRQKS